MSARYIVAGRYVLHSMWRQRSSPYWQARYRDLMTGMQRKFSTGQILKRAAELEAVRWLEALRPESPHPDSARSGAPQFTSAYREWLDLRTLQPSTRRGYEMDARVIMLSFGHMGVSRIERRDVEYFLKKLETERRSSARTRKKYLQYLRSFFAWAIDRGLATVDPTARMKIPRGIARMGYALTYDQARALLRAALDGVADGSLPRDLRLAIMFGLYAGMRKGNVVDLEWGEVDLREGIIAIPAEKYQKAKRPHEIPIHRRLAFELAIAGDRPAPVAWNGSLLPFRRALRRAGLPESIRFHDLRHTFATWLQDYSPDRVVSACLGHYAVRDVTDRYVHVTRARKREAIDALPWMV